MVKNSFRRLCTNASSSPSKFSYSYLLFVWSCLIAASMAQSVSPTLNPSYSDHGYRTLITTQDTLYYELSSSEIQLSDTMGFTQEVSKVHSTTPLPEMILTSKEVTPSSGLPEVTRTSLYPEMTSYFTDVAKFPIPILSTSLHLHSESPESSVDNSEIYRNFTPSLALSFSSSKFPEAHLERTIRSYDSTLTVNSISDHAIVSPSPSSTSTNVAPASSFSISPVESFKLLSSTADTTQLPTFYSNSTIESDKVNSNISDSTTTTSIPKKATNTKYESVRYFLVLKTEDCPPLGTSSLNSEIQKALSSFGIIKVKAKISKMGCQTTLHVNITARAPSSAAIDLDEVSNQNLTITVFNRSFQITDILQQQSNFNKTDARLTSNVINLVAQSIFKAYVAVGSCFGLVLLVCVVGYCYKCWSNTSRKRLGPRSNHSPLTPEDYTLTPIPRPTSLYVDYYRNSLTADLYSTTSAGSAGSASPIVEAGVVQPFDTSIVPLEDSETHFHDSKSQRDSAQSANEGNVQVVTVDGLIYSNSGNDSTEKLTANQASQQQKATGVCNPTYQRY